MTKQFEFEICTGRGNGMYTLRGLHGYEWDGTPRMSHIINLSRDPHQALEKARQYIISQGDSIEGLAKFDPDNVRDLNVWGECDAQRQQDLRLIDKGVMPFGKYFGAAYLDRDWETIYCRAFSKA